MQLLSFSALFQVLLPPKGDLLVTLSLTGNFSRFIDLLKKSGVADELQSKGPFTLFAPTNQVSALFIHLDFLIKQLKKYIVNPISTCRDYVYVRKLSFKYQLA